MRIILPAIIAASIASPAIAATSTPAPQPAPVPGVQKVEQKDAPLRLRDPLKVDDRRILAPGRTDSGTSRPNPKNGGGPEIG